MNIIYATMLVQGSFITHNVVTDFVLDMKDLSYGRFEKYMGPVHCRVGLCIIKCLASKFTVVDED